MKKERYEKTEMEIIRFSVADVLTGSDDFPIGGNVKLPDILK